MPPLPPAELVLGHLREAVLPAAGGAALVMCLFLLLGRWAGSLGSAAAVAVGFGWANYTFTKVAWGETGRLLPWVPDGAAPAWHWLPRAGLVLVVVGLLSRWVGLIAERCLPERRWWGANVLVWVPRVAAVIVVSQWLVSGRVAAESGWLVPSLAAAMVLGWVALDGVARSGAGAQVAAYQSLMLLAAGVVFLYAHTARFMEIEVVLGCAMFGVAVAAGATKADASGAVPAGVVFLPGLVLAGRPSLAENSVPAVSFWLVALAPLALLPFAIPAVTRRTGRLTPAIRALLVLAPLVAAAILAAQHEQIVFEEEW